MLLSGGGEEVDVVLCCGGGHYIRSLIVMGLYLCERQQGGESAFPLEYFAFQSNDTQSKQHLLRPKVHIRPNGTI